jgi:hypothetical protein
LLTVGFRLVAEVGDGIHVDVLSAGMRRACWLRVSRAWLMFD